MKLRDSFQNFIKYKVGTGNSIHIWFDYWHPVGPLVRRFGEMIVYDCAISKLAKLSDFIVNGD